MSMKRAIVATAAVLVAALSIAGFFVFSGHAAAAAQPPQLNYGPQLNAAQCGSGTSVVDVTYKVVNDLDSSVTGANWATDSFNKHVQVWQTGANTFCAIVRYEGSFVTLGSNSPQNTQAQIPAGITGTSEGGYRATFTGALIPSPTDPAFGNMGTVDASSSTAFDWTQAYFTNFDNFDQVWWGWIYRTPKNGTWVNACDGSPACPGNSGDITG